MPCLAASRRQAEVCAPPPVVHAATFFARHAPERTLLYALVEAHYPDFIGRLEAEDCALPAYVREEFEEHLCCGGLDHGFLRVVCEQCRDERLVAFSCKKRGFCPSCGARRMAESARHLVDEVFGPRPVRQWVLSFPYPLRFLFAGKPEPIRPVLGIVQRVIGGWFADQPGVPRDTAQCGATTLIQRFGSALNLNVHFHMLWLDGVYERAEQPQRKPRHRRSCDEVPATQPAARPGPDPMRLRHHRVALGPQTGIGETWRRNAPLHDPVQPNPTPGRQSRAQTGACVTADYPPDWLRRVFKVPIPKVPVSVSVMNFVGGARFTPTTDAAQASPYRHLLKPRSGGVAFVVDAMGDMLKSLVDVTLVYPSGKPTVMDPVAGRVPEVIVQVRERPIPADLLHGDFDNDPAYRERFQYWFNAIWDEKDALIAVTLAATD